MKLQELSIEESLSIYGGSEASDSFMYVLGAACKGVFFIATWQLDYGLTYAISSTSK